MLEQFAGVARQADSSVAATRLSPLLIKESPLPWQELVPQGLGELFGSAEGSFAQTETLGRSSQTLGIYSLNVPSA